MKITTNIILLSILMSGLFSCGAPKKESLGTEAGNMNSIEGTITISGAFALYPLTNVWAEEFRKEFPNIRLNISAGGAGKGMADVLAGATDLGMFSREITQAEKDKGVWWISVAKDAVLPTVSDKNPVIDQLKGVGLTRDELSSFFLSESAGLL